ncbi:MAG: universal stress protein [Nitrosopumilaceae archaeon]|nr:universal stress protein [Nitrosopumilaceae archaeon]NIU01759.1 universal stress protein [Nitrosopumilaceae archaeon]NIU88159.1 universal stress protein [Nitrosopumilaceae archaeon]NIV66482.1 universal stress protein [Nitrosopumilaceae archaeon]NIX62361.1 universal stress protein [Nitrosopumilaceae archaeon]
MVKTIFSKILVCVDGSKTADKALKKAIQISDQNKSKIAILHVIDTTLFLNYYGSGFMVEYAPPPLPSGFKSDVKKQIRKELEKKMTKFQNYNLDYSIKIKVGNVADEILKSSKGFDLVVIGSRGMGKLKSALLGSVSSKVVENAKSPVLVVR